MAGVIQSSSQRRRPPPPPPSNVEPFCPTIDNTIFVWLDTCQTDFERFRGRFCQVTVTQHCQWLFFDKSSECYQFIIESVSFPKKVILVTSGRLGQNLIEDLHYCEQLDSVYIYCRNIEKYKEFAQHYNKVQGVYTDPVQLFTCLKKNLERKSDDSSSSSSSQWLSDTENIDQFSQPHLFWHPWTQNTCTKILPIKGQATIAVIQTIFVPFELILSTANNLISIENENQFSIFLTVNKREATLGTYINGQRHFLNCTSDDHHVLQVFNTDQEYTYWLNFCKETLKVMYGIGEIRPKFRILEAYIDEKYSKSISNIIYLHVKINGIYENFQTIAHLKDKINFSIGTLSLLEPNLFILRHNHSSTIYSSTSSLGISPFNLTTPSRALYHNLIHFKLDDDDFPDFISAIERSIKNPFGWCYQKLNEKANQFGRSNINLTCIRLALDPLIIEIWPSEHFSPIHNHKKAYGMFRVLYGCIFIRLFPYFASNLPSEIAIEYLVRQDQITWMLPKLNQTHQMKNVDHNSCCIIAQCYSYGDTEQKKTDEVFDYLTNNNQVIQEMKPLVDMNFGEFKEKIRKEWNEQYNL
ncbi:hypothetical protein I4U23_010403 [Adineta vaga]|nr:hypothetical protein I4U23_010403 [Adineta vaga]